MLLLVDSSVWINCLSNKPVTKNVEIVHHAKKQKKLATCDIIHLEVVRGARSQTEWDELSEEFHAMHFLHFEAEDYKKACHMGFTLARNGFHPPATDLLIAQIAIRNRCQLLHQDKDFLAIARHYPLKLIS